MVFEKIEKKISEINKKIKEEKVSQEIRDDVSKVINEIEELGDEAKNKFKDAIENMKNSLKKMK